MLYTYTSSRADYNPAKTILVFAPSDKVKTMEEAEAFAVSSGWQLLAEYEEAVLIIPLIVDGYSRLSTAWPGKILTENRNAFSSICGRSLYQRGEKLWCWECLVYMVGYDDGAEYAGNCLLAEPGRFAAAALVNGSPSDYTKGGERTSHPFLKEVSDDYVKRNCEIESRVWLYTEEKDRIREAEQYFGTGRVLTIKKCPASYDLNHSAEIMTGLFDKTVRWKDGPDGRVTDYAGRVSFYREDYFIQEKVTVKVTDYPVAVHLPKGLGKEDVKNFPLVFSVHGRGEPAWLFASKNGWDQLADETKEFVLAVPDSPGNLWQLERDQDAFPAMVNFLCEKYGLDRSRVYLTGFSNGAMITREAGSLHPELFAAVSAWNGPVHLTEELAHPVYMEKLREEGYEMPAWICVGDQDPAAGVESLREQLEYLLPVNGCRIEEDGSLFGYRCDEKRTAENYYTEDQGYLEGNRFHTEVYCRIQDREPFVCATVMKNMPHGAITEQSRACYAFMKRFRRINGGPLVRVISKDPAAEIREKESAIGLM